LRNWTEKVHCTLGVVASASDLWEAKTQTLSPILVTLLSIPPFCRFRNVALLKEVFSFRFTSYKSKKFDVSVIQTGKKRQSLYSHDENLKWRFPFQTAPTFQSIIAESPYATSSSWHRQSKRLTFIPALIKEINYNLVHGSNDGCIHEWKLHTQRAKLTFLLVKNSISVPSLQTLVSFKTSNSTILMFLVNILLRYRSVDWLAWWEALESAFWTRICTKMCEDLAHFL
jgi:hypothetical protein